MSIENVYSMSVSIPEKRIFKHGKKIEHHTESELGLKVLHCPVGGSFAVSNDSERTATHGYAKRFGMSYTVRNTPTDPYKRAFRLA